MPHPRYNLKISWPNAEQRMLSRYLQALKQEFFALLC